MRKRQVHSPELGQFLREHVILDPITELAQVKNLYAYLGFNFTWDGEQKTITYSNLIWFLTHNKWPKDGYHIDHINDNPLDNRPSNLQELTEAESQRKRRGRTIYRSYGTGKYGYGLGVYNDKRDGRFYVSRYMSRGHGVGDLKSVIIPLGGYDTLAEAEAKIAQVIESIKEHGLAYVPPKVNSGKKHLTKKADNQTRLMRRMRLQGKTVAEIAELMGLKSGVVYRRVRDLNVDCRSDR